MAFVDDVVNIIVMYGSGHREFRGGILLIFLKEELLYFV